MKYQLLAFFFLFFNSIVNGQDSVSVKSRFSHGVSIGKSRQNYLIDSESSRAAEVTGLKIRRNTDQFAWALAYNLEYRINKKIYLRTQAEFATHKTTLRFQADSGVENSFEIGSFDVGIPLHLLYKVGNKKRFRPFIFFGVKSIFATKIGNNVQAFNLSSPEFGLDAGAGLELNFKSFSIRQEVAFFNSLTPWLNAEYFFRYKTIDNMNRDFVSLRLVFSQRN